MTDPKKVILHDMKSISTMSILWFVVKRHKLGIMAVWAVTATVLALVPTFPSIAVALLFA